MIKYILCLSLVLFCSLFSIGQNLILNSGFEEYSQCPSSEDQLSYLKNWFNPSKTTPDFFHNCDGDSVNNKTIVGVPYNFNGYKKAHSGNGYVGIVINSPYPEFREYIQTKTTSQLIKGQSYEITFWLSMADSSTYQCNGIAFCVSNEKKIGTGDTNDGGVILTRKAGGNFISFVQKNALKDWIEVKSTFVAQGEENYITIGLFKEDNKRQKIKRIRKTEKTNMPYAYYYIDDIKLFAVSSTDK